jgi:hypothetical protein
MQVGLEQYQVHLVQRCLDGLDLADRVDAVGIFAIMRSIPLRWPVALANRTLIVFLVSPSMYITILQVPYPPGWGC